MLSCLILCALLNACAVVPALLFFSNQLTGNNVEQEEDQGNCTALVLPCPFRVQISFSHFPGILAN
jgi:hypothetical protein